MLNMSASTILAQNPPTGGGAPGQGRQGRGNFDPAQMVERYKERLEITDDAEWKAIQPLVLKVSEARMSSFGGRGMRGQRPGDTAQADPNQRSTNPERDALQKAIDAKASAAELANALQKYSDARKVKQAELEKVQAELRKVLTPRQEAIATLYGLL